MNLALLVDIGSTFTKSVLVDLNEGKLIGWASAPTTASTDVTAGLIESIENLKRECYFSIDDVGYKAACSSASGGLRLVAIGLVPELTLEAARLAAMGAGARIIKVYAYELSLNELMEIEQLKPDLILLVGGTDGGNKDVVLHNASLLANINLQAPVVYAGNKVVSNRIEGILSKAGKRVSITENVMPTLDCINVEPVREKIRQIFIENIINAKGLDKAERIIDKIIMPTPYAVLMGAGLLNSGPGGQTKYDDLMVVDVGGATTDVYSFTQGSPSEPDMICKGIKEPIFKRTVEGDLGVRINATNVAQCLIDYEDVTGIFRHLKGTNTGNTNEIINFWESRIHEISHNTSINPVTQDESIVDVILARTCVRTAVSRHVGHVEYFRTIEGQIKLLTGKDMTYIKTLIGTGGPIVRSRWPDEILAGALFDASTPTLMKPKNPEFYIDKNYLLFAGGLLSFYNKTLAYRLLESNISRI